MTDLPDDAGTITDDAGLTAFAIVAPVPNLNQWYHIALDVKRNPDGSGAVGFDINYPGRVAPPQIPAGYLTEAPPAVGDRDQRRRALGPRRAAVRQRDGRLPSN